MDFIPIDFTSIIDSFQGVAPNGFDCGDDVACAASQLEICDDLIHAHHNMQATTAWERSPWLITLGCLSIALSYASAGFIYKHKSLQVHPMKIVMTISFAEGIMF